MTRASTQATQQRVLACALGGTFSQLAATADFHSAGRADWKICVPARSLRGTQAVSLCARRTCCPLIVIERENKTAKRISA